MQINNSVSFFFSSESKLFLAKIQQQHSFGESEPGEAKTMLLEDFWLKTYLQATGGFHVEFKMYIFFGQFWLNYFSEYIVLFQQMAFILIKCLF